MVICSCVVQGNMFVTSIEYVYAFRGNLSLLESTLNDYVLFSSGFK